VSRRLLDLQSLNLAMHLIFYLLGKQMKTDLLIDLLDDELRKFSNLCIDLSLIMPMFSPLIDNHWHKQIEEVQRFRLLPFHDATIKSSAPTIIDWIPYYEAYYGKLKKVWFVDSKGIFLHNSYDNYISTGEVVATFNCAGKAI
jgi:hypothetical protein